MFLFTDTNTQALTHKWLKEGGECNLMRRPSQFVTVRGGPQVKASMRRCDAFTICNRKWYISLYPSQVEEFNYKSFKFSIGLQQIFSPTECHRQCLTTWESNAVPVSHLWSFISDSAVSVAWLSSVDTLGHSLWQTHTRIFKHRHMYFRVVLHCIVAQYVWRQPVVMLVRDKSAVRRIKTGLHISASIVLIASGFWFPG